MPKREYTVILINGKQLHQCSIAEIVEAAVNPARRAYDLGDCGDFYHNCHVLWAFGQAEEATTEELVDRFHVAQSYRDFSRNFDALRLGEALQAGIKHGIVERIGAYPTQKWRLLQRERLFECVGPERKQHAIQVRGLKGPEAHLANKFWQRELKRRERARVKDVAKYGPTIRSHIDEICRRAPDYSLRDGSSLEKYVVGEHHTISVIRRMIEDAIDGMDSADLFLTERGLEKIRRKLPPPPPPPPKLSPEDDAILANLYL